MDVKPSNTPIEEILRMCLADLGQNFEAGMLQDQINILKQEGINTEAALKYFVERLQHDWKELKLNLIIKAKIEEFLSSNYQFTGTKRKQVSQIPSNATGKFKPGDFNNIPIPSRSHFSVKLSPCGTVKEIIENRIPKWENVAVVCPGLDFIYADMDDLLQNKSAYRTPVKIEAQDGKASICFHDFPTKFKSGRVYVLRVGTTADSIQESLPLVFLTNPANQKERSTHKIFLWKKKNGYTIEHALDQFYFGELRVHLHPASLEFLKGRFNEDGVNSANWKWLFTVVKYLKEISRTPLWKAYPYLLRSVFIFDEEKARTFVTEVGDFLLRSVTNLDVNELPEKLLAATYIQEVNLTSAAYQKVAFGIEDLKTGVFMKKVFLERLICVDDEFKPYYQQMVMYETPGNYQPSTELPTRRAPILNISDEDSQLVQDITSQDLDDTEILSFGYEDE